MLRVHTWNTVAKFLKTLNVNKPKRKKLMKTNLKETKGYLKPCFRAFFLIHRIARLIRLIIKLFF